MPQKKYEYRGELWTLADLARLAKVKRTTFSSWLRRNVSIEEAMRRNIREPKKIKVGNTSYTVAQICKLAKIARPTYYSRVNAGWTIKEIIGKSPYTRGVTAFGRTQSLSAWSRELGIPRTTLIRRMKVQGMTPEQAFSERYYHCNFVTAFGRTQSVKAWAKERNILPKTINYRLSQKLPPEVALSAPVEKRE